MFVPSARDGGRTYITDEAYCSSAELLILVVMSKWRRDGKY